MDVLKYIAECRESMGGAQRVSAFLENQKYLEELARIACSDMKHPYPEYASWLLLNVCKKEKALIEPFLEQIIDRVLSTSNQSVLRNLTNILNFFPISKYREGELLDKLIQFIKNDSNKPALFVYSIYVLAKYTLKYPDIKSEILGIIENKQNALTPAIRIGIRNYHSLTKTI
jgi:hypothetical protein